MRETARVKIRVVGKVLDEVVALASMEELDGNRLLPLHLRNEDSYIGYFFNF